MAGEKNQLVFAWRGVFLMSTGDDFGAKAKKSVAMIELVITWYFFTHRLC